MIDNTKIKKSISDIVEILDKEGMTDYKLIDNESCWTITIRKFKGQVDTLN